MGRVDGVLTLRCVGSDTIKSFRGDKASVARAGSCGSCSHPAPEDER